MNISNANKPFYLICGLECSYVTNGRPEETRTRETRRLTLSAHREPEKLMGHWLLDRARLLKHSIILILTQKQIPFLT